MPFYGEMSEHFSNNRKINDLTVEGDTAKERSREIREVSPHSGCSQSIKPSIYTDWGMMQTAPAEVSEREKKTDI